MQVAIVIPNPPQSARFSGSLKRFRRGLPGKAVICRPSGLSQKWPTQHKSL